MSGGIFISYRHDDDPAFAGRLFDRLERAYSRDQVFIDVDAIEPGLDFVQILNEQVARCDVLLAVIGKRWLTAANEDGVRRLDNPHDFVRIEIEAALKRNIRVIPVLVEGATLPREGDLPECLQPLIRRHAVKLSHQRFGAEADSLVKVLARVVPPGVDAAPPSPAPPPPTTVPIEQFDPTKPPNLTHTRLQKAEFADHKLERPKWNSLARHAVEFALTSKMPLYEVCDVSAANVVAGQKLDAGYRPLRRLGYSMQGVDAQDAWRIAYSLARELNCSIVVDFQWLQRASAAHPGAIATLAWHPKSP